MNPTLHAGIGASAFEIDFDRIPEWKTALDCAQWLSLSIGDHEHVRVDLAANTRWIAFRKIINGSPMSCIGHQETFGVTRQGGIITGGFNRKTLAWLHPSGRVFIGESLD